MDGDGQQTTNDGRTRMTTTPTTDYGQRRRTDTDDDDGRTTGRREVEEGGYGVSGFGGTYIYIYIYIYYFIYTYIFTLHRVSIISPSGWRIPIYSKPEISQINCKTFGFGTLPTYRF
jgi:hypothetical protein